VHQKWHHPLVFSLSLTWRGQREQWQFPKDNIVFAIAILHNEQVPATEWQQCLGGSLKQ
jgi:hypothetical protein